MQTAESARLGFKYALRIECNLSISANLGVGA